MRLQNKSYAIVGDEEKAQELDCHSPLKSDTKRIGTCLCKNDFYILFNYKSQIIFLENSFRNNEHAFAHQFQCIFEMQNNKPLVRTLHFRQTFGTLDFISKISTQVLKLKLVYFCFSLLFITHPNVCTKYCSFLLGENKNRKTKPFTIYILQHPIPSRCLFGTIYCHRKTKIMFLTLHLN